MFRVAPISTRNQFGELLNGRGLTGEAVEIGTHRADFANALLDSWKGWMLYCIDPWATPHGYEEQSKLLWGGASSRSEDFQEAQSRLAIYEGRFALVCGTSQGAAEVFHDDQIDFAYIDGDHRYSHVLWDLKHWWPKIKPGGILAGHDWAQPGEAHTWAGEVQRALQVFLMGFPSDPPDVQLVVEEGGLPWSFYMVKQ